MRALLPVILFACTVSRAFPAHRLGAAGGFPQMAAVAYQYTPFRCTTLEAYAGTLVFNGTVGGRLILSRTGNGLSPRAFTGICIFDQWYGSSGGDPTGTTSYLWTGAGMGWNFQGGQAFYADVGWLTGGDDGKGLGSDYSLAICGGLLFPI